MENNCIIKLEIERSVSPWKNFTGSYEEEQATKEILSEKLTPSMERPPFLSKYKIHDEDLLAIDRPRKRVVLNEKYFAPFARTDATKLKENSKTLIGKIKPQLSKNFSYQKISNFLLESQIILTYWHIKADLCMIKETDTPDAYWAGFSGEHIYFTNEKNTGSLRFSILIDKKDGSVYLTD